MRRSLVIVTLLALHALPAASARAHADPSDFVGRPLVLDHRQVAGELVLDLNLAPGYVGESTSLAPDVWVGVLPRLTVGLIHSAPSVDRFAPGATFCVVHQDIGCRDTYHGSSLDVRWSAIASEPAVGGELAVAPRLRALVRQLDPFKPALAFGTLVRWTRGRFAITGDPYLQLGLANTERGNRHALFVPVTFAVEALPRWDLALRTGWHSELAVIRDGWHVPVALVARVRATAHVDAGVMLGFASLLGPQNTAKERALFFTLGYRS